MTVCDICHQPLGDEVAKYGGEPVHPDCIPLPDGMEGVKRQTGDDQP